MHTTFQWYITSAAEKSPLNNWRINHSNQYQAYSMTSDKIQSQVVTQNMLLHMMSSGSELTDHISCLWCLKNNGFHKAKFLEVNTVPLWDLWGWLLSQIFTDEPMLIAWEPQTSKRNITEESRMNFSSKLGLFKTQNEKKTY
jgi:saccharopine dehydrogenase-like NADP-dependent oxidoreductase